MYSSNVRSQKCPVDIPYSLYSARDKTSQYFLNLWSSRSAWGSTINPKHRARTCRNCRRSFCGLDHCCALIFPDVSLCMTEGEMHCHLGCCYKFQGWMDRTLASNELQLWGATSRIYYTQTECRSNGMCQHGLGSGEIEFSKHIGRIDALNFMR